MYNKKQMQPIIAKFAINPETNKLFKELCDLFDGQPNYQIWAVKAVFSKNASFDAIKKIKDWTDKNQSMIQHLSKQNVVSYSTKNDFVKLEREIDGLNALNVLKDFVSRFNTDQRKLLTNLLFKDKSLTALNALTFTYINYWHAIAQKFLKLPMARKNNVYIVCSSFKDVSDIEAVVLNAISEDYSWEKEDMLAFLENNTTGCDVVYNNGPFVIVRVGNFDASKKLCGGGRTQWCITKKDSFFKDYTGGGTRDQYFLFDFSRKETDCFAHIGFTIENGRGLVYAQTCDNKGMIGEFVNGTEKTTFQNHLNKIGVSMDTFMRLRGTFPFAWDIVSVINKLSEYPNYYAIAHEGNDKLVISILDRQGLKTLTKHTYITDSDLSANDKCYLLLNFKEKADSGKSIICLKYRKDQYGDLSLFKINDAFNNIINRDEFFKEQNLSQDEFINRESIDPRVLFHKYIDEKDEISAIKLIKKQGADFDVNYTFNDRIPVFSCLSFSMKDLFKEIINHPKWDSTITDGFGETLLESLIFLNGVEDIERNKAKEKEMDEMIALLAKSKKIDFNVKDFTSDTALNVAVEFPRMVWLVKILLAKREVDVNIVNECDCAPLTTCIRKKNFKALELLGKRPDLIVREVDKKLANSLGIDLREYIKPTESIFDDEETSESEHSLESIMVGA